MSLDLVSILEGWPFVEGQVTVRQIEGADGRPKIQLRLDLGILQMELDGRPDGQRPMGHDSLFDSYKELAGAFEDKDDADLRFSIDSEDCGKLQQEAVQYYHRYLALFQLSDWPRVIRDTKRNLALFDFVEKHAEHEALGWSFQQFRPYVLMMLTRARGQEALLRKQYEEALRVIQDGVNDIRHFFEKHHREELATNSPEIRFLENWHSELLKNKPLTERAKLEKALAAAIAREDYEAAAALRDNLKQLTS